LDEGDDDDGEILSMLQRMSGRYKDKEKASDIEVVFTTDKVSS
jgi:hypothetical protein